MASKNEAYVRSTPKGIGADGIPDIPSTYNLRKFLIKNQYGKIFDLKPIIKSFTLTEELFSPVIVLNVSIRDNTNFFEDFAVSGQEVIDLHLERRDPGKNEPRHVKIKFNVKEYPNYVKSAEEPNIQEYNLIAVSEFAYRSSLMRISRSVKGSPIDNIKEIFDKDLNVKIVETAGVCPSIFNGILTIQSPMKAIEWLRSKAFDQNGAPFFVYNTIVSEGIPTIRSLSEMISKENYPVKTFKYKQFVKNAQGLKSSNENSFFDENSDRILDMKSNIRLDKLAQAMSGGFANKVNVTDYSRKTFTEQIFDHSADSVVNKNRIDSKSLYAQTMDFLVNGLVSSTSLDKLSDASISNISANSLAIDGGRNSTSGPLIDNLTRAKSYIANLEAVSHMIQIYGNFGINPGRKITIEVPKAVNRNFYEQNVNPENKDELDRSLSGEYIVAMVAHTFDSGVYTSKVKIIKDSL